MSLYGSLWLLVVVGWRCSGWAVDAKTNIVLIMADDMEYDLIQYMPNVQKMQKEGTSFQNAFTTNSLCCPSRATFFTGNLPHRTRVLINDPAPLQNLTGGVSAFKDFGNEALSYGKLLQAASYRTALMGKYLNGYNATTDPPPPGWGSWAVTDNGYGEYRYTLNQNGRPVYYGTDPSDYLTDVLNQRAVEFLEAGQPGRPFFIQIATFAPHKPYTPAPRDANKFPGLRAPRTPAFNALMTNPPSWLVGIPPLNASFIAQIDGWYRLRAQSVLAIDKLVGDVRATLQRRGLSGNTTVFFTADNGYHMAAHRQIPGKQTAFTTDIRIPLIVVGPKVPAGRVVDRIVQNTDLCPTFAELAGSSLPGRDGVSLVPLLQGRQVSGWRSAALIEHWGPNIIATTMQADPDLYTAGPIKNFANPTTYEALRGKDYLYVEYNTGEREFHNLTLDKYELNNTYKFLPVAQQTAFKAHLQRLRICTGAQCHN